LNELKERVAQDYDPSLLVEALDISSEEILLEFEDKLMDKLEDFKEYEND